MSDRTSEKAAELAGLAGTEAITPPDITIIPPSGTVVPNGFVFVETAYEPHVTVTQEEVVNLSDSDLLTGLKKQRKRTQEELDAFVVFFDETVGRFKDVQQRGADGQFQPGVKPTLPEAFAAIGLHYETERKRKQRYLTAKNTKLRLRGQLKLKEGDIVEDAATEYCVLSKPTKSGQVEIAPTGGTVDDAVTLPIKSLAKTPVKTIELNDLILCVDTGKQYRYIGKGLLKSFNVWPLIKQKQGRDAAAIAVQQEQMMQAAQAKLEDKARHNDLLKDEMTNRDRRLVTTRPEKDKKSSPNPTAARAQKSAKPEKPKTKAELEAEKKKAEEKAKQDAQDRARSTELQAATDALVARLGYDQSSRFIGKQDDEEVSRRFDN